MAVSTRRLEEQKESTKIVFDDISKQVVDAAFKIHQAMGPGLLEGIYEECFAIALRKRRLKFERQKEIPVYFEGELLNAKCRLDFLVEDSLILELKSVERIIPAHQAQILTYLKTANVKQGFLINFGEPYFKKAIKRFVM